MNLLAQLSHHKAPIQHRAKLVRPVTVQEKERCASQSLVFHVQCFDDLGGFFE